MTSTMTQEKPSSQKAGISAAGSGTQVQLVTFGVANEEFAVEILAVQEINRMMELTRVPQSPAEVEGVINLRGKIIPVVDLRKRFGMPAGVRNESNRIIVIEVHKRVIGFIVDRVHEVLRVDSGIMEPAPAMVCSIKSDFIAGVGKLQDRLLILLDLPKLFSADSVNQMSKAA